MGRAATRLAGRAALIALSAATAATAQVAPFAVVGDAIPQPLAGLRGDVTRGRSVVLDRAVGNCLICHHVPEPAERFMGDLAPDLSGVGSRLAEGQLRLRVVDQARISPKTIMPPYHRTEGLVRVAPQYRGKPVLDAQQVEDVVAYLTTLK
jgi:sulfur-oxidizing protein SoxX